MAQERRPDREAARKKRPAPRLDHKNQAIRHRLELDAVFEAFPNLLFLIDADDVIVDYRAGRVADLYVSPEEFLGKRPDQFLPPSVAHRIVVALDGARRHQRHTLVEYTLEVPEGLQHFEARLVPLERLMVAGLVTNVTDRKRVEERARLSEQKYRNSQERSRTLIEHSSELTLILDRDGAIRYASPAVEHVQGYTPEEMAGRDGFELIHPDDLVEAKRVFAEELREPDSSSRIELRIRDRAGSWRSVDGTVRNLLHLPAVEGYVINARDITERKKAEEALRRSEAYLRAIVDSEPECVKVVAPDGRLLQMNDAGLRMLEVKSLEEASNLLDFVVEEDRPDFIALQRRVLAGERSEIEFRAVSAKGARRWFHTVGAPLGGEVGAESAILCITRDITEKKRAEQELQHQAELLQTIFDQIPVIVAMLDSEGRFLTVNREWERLLGWTMEEVQRHPDMLAALYPDKTVRQEARESMGAALPGWRDLKTTTRDGGAIETRWASVRLSDGRTIAIGQDISGIRRLEAQAWQARKLESIGRLAGGVAHDFNNILAAVLGYVELLEREPSEGERARGYLEEIKSAGSRARDLTAQLLAFGRRQVMAPTVLSLNDLAAGMSRLLRRLLGDDIELVTRFESGLWYVKADPAQIEQVLMNLALNARDAMPAGGTLTIETANEVCPEGEPSEAVQGSRPCVMLAVSDTGRGMEPEMLEHVFEPFYTTKEVGLGSGLGLATVYGIVAQSEGRIRAHSEPGEGTTFRIYLPRSADDPEPPAPSPPAEASRGHETVLVVEDDPHVRRLLAESLRLAGYTVLVATSGDEALALSEREPGEIHLLLTDVVMPRMSGKQVAESLRRERPSLRCLYASGYDQDIIVRRGVLPSGVHFLQKPFGVSGLLAKVRAALDSGDSQQ